MFLFLEDVCDWSDLWCNFWSMKERITSGVVAVHVVYDIFVVDDI